MDYNFFWYICKSKKRKEKKRVELNGSNALLTRPDNPIWPTPQLFFPLKSQRAGSVKVHRPRFTCRSLRRLDDAKT